MRLAINDSALNRRRLVAHYRVRGHTKEEIYLRLIEDGVLNPDTQEPYATSTIDADVSYLTKQWRQDMMQDVADHKGRIFMELQEVKFAAWDAKDLPTVLSAIRQERELLGLDAAPIFNVNLLPSDALRSKLERMQVEFSELPPDELQALPPLQLPELVSSNGHPFDS